MPKNRIKDLRDSLFETIERLMDPEDPMDINRAKAVAHVAQTVINTAKAEIDFMRVAKRTNATDWFTDDHELISGSPDPKQLVAAAAQPKLRALSNRSKEEYTDLCLNCPLPQCDETSPQCLIQIEVAKSKAVAA